ncbi:MAG: cyclic pyranopterin monophosphate synthase MoaC [Phycisphaerales bacterium]
MSDSLSHIDERGRARMVDVGAKPVVTREAIAEGFVHAAASTIDRIMTGDGPKGDVLAVANVAGVQAAKRCDELIPLCHALPLDVVTIDFERTQEEALRIEVRVRTSARTGVEMEALTAVSVAALTVYDMTKAIDKSMSIDGVRVLEKRKGPATG